jgi:hypothetical protein
LSSAITEAAEEVLELAPKTRRDDWFDDECKEWAKKRREAERALRGSSIVNTGKRAMATFGTYPKA